MFNKVFKYAIIKIRRNRNNNNNIICAYGNIIIESV